MESQQRRTRHPAAKFLAGELDIGPIGRDIVASRSNCSVESPFVSAERPIFLKHGLVGLDSSRPHDFGTLQTKVCNHSFDLARVSLLLDATRRPSDNPIEDLHLFVVAGSRPQSG